MATLPCSFIDSNLATRVEYEKSLLLPAVQRAEAETTAACQRVDILIPPLIFVQSISNCATVLGCSRCGAFAGGLKGQLVASVLPTSLDQFAEAVKKAPLTRDAPAKDAVGCISFCRLGCGVLFCCASCEAAAHDAGHALLCVGPLAEDDAMVRAKVVATHSGSHETITIATQVLAMAIKKGEDGTASRLLQETVKSSPPWEFDEGDVEIGELLGDYLGVDDEIQCMSSVCWKLLCEALPIAQRKDLTEDVWVRLLGYVSRKAIAVERTSPILEYALKLSSADVEAREALLNWAGDFDDVTEEGDHVGGDDPLDSSAASAPQQLLNDANRFTRLLVEADELLPKLRGFVLVPELTEIAISCLPSHAATTTNSIHGPLLLTLAPMFHFPVASRPMTICPFPTDRNLEQRAILRRERVAPELCECSRCVFETEAAAADAIGLTELHAIATVAQQDGRFKDALKAYGAILAKEPADSHGRCQSHDHAFIVPERIVERS